MLHTGGPAFPVGVTNGMSLRDYFAAKAMQSYISDKEFVDACVFMEKDVKEEIARVAYAQADAMLIYREQK
jgi:hypothetical protein